MGNICVYVYICPTDNIAVYFPLCVDTQGMYMQGYTYIIHYTYM